MKRVLIFSLCSILFGHHIFAQTKCRVQNVLFQGTSEAVHEPVPPKRTCGTMELHRHLLKNDPEYAKNIERIERYTQEYIKNAENFKSSSIITIPVVFHVVYENATENISNTRIMEQLDVLNQDFSKTNSDAGLVPTAFKSLHVDTEIRFCLATKDPNGNPTTGITRTPTTKSSFSITSNDVKYSSTGGKDAWNTQKYLNIWICDLGSSLLGYAQFPGGDPATDGVVLNYRFVGKTGAVAPYNKGRTGTHEVGHYLNLRHIWGDDSGCSPDDFVADTPTQDEESSGCPTFPLTDACQPSSPGIMFMNYMDYTDDACMYMFTAGQKARMRAALTGPRASLTTSSATNCSGSSGGGPTTCDTLLYPFPGTPALYKLVGSGNWGYVSGMNSYKDRSKANYFSDHPSALNQVKGIIFKFVRGHYTNPNNKINVRLWNESGGKPASTPLISVPLNMSVIGSHVSSGQYTVVNFTSAISVGSTFYAGFSFEMSGSNYAYPSDTVAVLSNSDGDTNPGIAWEQFNDGDWYPFSSSSSWDMNLALAIMPIACPASIHIEDKLIDNSFNLQVFPNPSNGTFEVVYPIFSNCVVVTVHNILGQEVFKEVVTQSQDKLYQKQFNFNYQAKGLYVVRVTDGNFTAVKKIQVH
ncbi:MAG: M43 family zinc metalloprotease [Bacteroidia bacterium]|nr:M43 family zinc metalloprotease [Bacteroidia bacterium]MDW8301481.1 M43 family zinc metalloprotease [Bacteroidia bacterium]